MTRRFEATHHQTTAGPSRQLFLERQPTYWLKRSYQALRRRVEADLRPFGVTLSQRDALLTLEHEGPHSHGMLAAKLGLEQSSVSRLVDGLARRGLVEIREGTDRRSRFVSLTEEGRRILHMTPGASQVAGSILAETLSEAELQQMISLLRRSTYALEHGSQLPEGSDCLTKERKLPQRPS